MYLNQVGLPDILKRPLLEKLRARGVDLQFSRLRLSWNQGIVAENVHFGPADQQSGPNLNVAEVQVRLNWKALAQLQLQVDSLMLRQGRVSWIISQSQGPVRELSVAKIQTDLRFLPGDEWALDHFRAQFAGANIELWGVVTNASAIRDWKIFKGKQPVSTSATLWQDRLRHIADTLEGIRFSYPPELRVNVRGDALDLYTFNVLLSLSAPGAETPWGTVSQGRFAAHLFSMDTNGVSRAELDVHAGEALTPWAAITNLSLTVNLTSVDTQTNLVNGELKLLAAQVRTPWANGSYAAFAATWTHSMTNPVPVSGRGKLNCAFAQTSWASARDIQLSGSFITVPNTNFTADGHESWSWWTNLEPYQLSWDSRLSDLKSSKFVTDRVSCAGEWRAPQLTVTNLEAALLQGSFAADGTLDIATRAVHLSFASDLDPHRLSPFLPKSVQTLVERFSWPKAPRVNAELSATLPAWTNHQPDWLSEVQPTLTLAGELMFEQGASYEQLQVVSAQTHFVYSNQFWHLPDLTLVRPEGLLQAEHSFDERTKDFYWRVSSTVNPAAVRPLLDESARAGIDLFSFTQPPKLHAEVWGRYDDPGRIRARGDLTGSNFTFRGEAITQVQTRIEYTNHLITFLEPRIDVGPRYAKADALTVDLDAQLIYLTNGFSIADPMLIARAIGPQIAEAIQDYQFQTPPTAHVQGIIPLHGEEGADLHFDLEGGPFHWWKFNVPQISGHVHWSGLHLSLTNVQTEFYYGTAFGWAAFDFPPNRGTDFQFVMSVTNVLLQSLMADLATATNHLEGRLYGDLAVTKANSDSWQTVFGQGEAHLRDGLLWDIPIFGIFSPVLNGIAPGLGNSRASAANATFIITNGVIRTSDLEIRSTGMRLGYRGTVNLEGQVNAHVEAELLRDMWLVGPLVSTVFWPVAKLFEYKVTGTLADPRSQPVFIVPKIMLMPFHPFRTLKGLFPEDPNSNPNFSPLPP